METVTFNGYEFGFQRGYYCRTGPKTLHQAVWEYHNGPIPPKYQIHHKDGDAKNNVIENLEILTKKEHDKLHSKCKYQKWVGSDANREQLESARSKANKWHASPEGRKFHSALGKYSWKYRKRFVRECDVCHAEYTCAYPKRSNFCSGKCKAANRRLQGKDRTKRTCIICKSVFATVKYSKARTCSPGCSNKLQNQTKRRIRLDG